jgi:hypothetical protein
VGFEGARITALSGCQREIRVILSIGLLEKYVESAYLNRTSPNEGQVNPHDVNQLAFSGSFIAARGLILFSDLANAMTLEMTLAPSVSKGRRVESVGR